MSNGQAQRKVQKFVVSGGTNEHSLQRGYAALHLPRIFRFKKIFFKTNILYQMSGSVLQVKSELQN